MHQYLTPFYLACSNSSLYCTLSLLVNILVRDLVKSEKRGKAREKGSREWV